MLLQRISYNYEGDVKLLKKQTNKLSNLKYYPVLLQQPKCKSRVVLRKTKRLGFVNNIP